MHLQTRKARPGVETRTGWPLSTAGCHRPDGDCHHDDVGRDGVHRGCEADDDDRHQPHVQAAARPPFLICAWRILCSKPRREWTRQRRPAVAGRSDRVPAKGKPKAVLLRALRGAATPVSGSRDGVPGDGVRADRSARPPGALPAGRAGVGQASACSSNASMMRFAAPLTCWAVCLMLSASMWLHPAT
ncbi:Uncharacterised protein [Bifidobacterium longum]|uniref:Uncharacterized protein n=1 Tax=Bifidobacterium longum TaxID=216816 RepID=A0A6N2TQ65_BIFLN